MYFPNGRSRSIESGTRYRLNNCGSGGVGETPVECTTTIPADACEAEQIHEEDIPGYGPWRHVLRAICRPAKVVLHTRVGGDPRQAYRNEVCIRTRAVFNGRDDNERGKLSVEADQSTASSSTAPEPSARPRCGRA